MFQNSSNAKWYVTKNGRNIKTKNWGPYNRSEEALHTLRHYIETHPNG